MYISYHWENMSVNVEGGNGMSPHTHKEIRDVDYEYYHNITTRDIVDYLMPYSLRHKKDKTPNEVNEIRIANCYMERVLEFLNDCNSIDYDTLENDELFVEFMHDRYENDALDEWEESNQPY